MEPFEEAETGGKVTLILGRKVLVVDLEPAMDRNDESHPTLSVIALKASYTSPVGGAATMKGSVSMNGFPMYHIQELTAGTYKPLGGI
jgi:hypothetical protein